MINHPIIIVGAPRSGTSMTAGIINLSGAFGGDMFDGTKDNKKGFFENRFIREQICKPCLKTLGADPAGQFPLPDIEEVKLASVGGFNNWRVAVIVSMMKEGYDNKQQWFYKGVKSTLLWPLWHRAFPEARWIIVRRDSKDIVLSCLKTSFMRHYKNEAGWYHFVDEYKERFIQMHNAKLDIKEIWPQKFIDRDYSELERVINFLGLTYDQDKIESFIEPALWSTK